MSAFFMELYTQNDQPSFNVKHIYLKNTVNQYIRLNICLKIINKYIVC